MVNGMHIVRDDYLFLETLAFAFVADFTSPLLEIFLLSAFTSVEAEVSDLAPKIAEFSLACSLASSEACAAACDLARASPFTSVFVLAAFSFVVSILASAFFYAFVFTSAVFFSALSTAGLASTFTSALVEVAPSAFTPKIAEFSLAFAFACSDACTEACAFTRAFALASFFTSFFTLVVVSTVLCAADCAAPFVVAFTLAALLTVADVAAFVLMAALVAACVVALVAACVVALTAPWVAAAFTDLVTVVAPVIPTWAKPAVVIKELTNTKRALFTVFINYCLGYYFIVCSDRREKTQVV
jgi:hypothetical protein